MKAIEHLLEVLIFNSRWLLAPFYLGLVAGIVMLLVKFGQELIHVVPNIFAASESEVVLEHPMRWPLSHAPWPRAALNSSLVVGTKTAPASDP